MKGKWLLLPFSMLMLIAIATGIYLNGEMIEKEVTESMAKTDPIEEIELPRVVLSGDVERIEESDDYAYLQMAYEDEENSFSCYAKVRIQGATSREYSKKNYKIKLYEDGSFLREYAVDFADWGEASTYYLKANYTDALQAHNIVAGRLWGEVEETGSHQNEYLKELINAGATDGFPVLVYLNEECVGLYTLNIPKDAWIFHMPENSGEEKNAIIFASGQQYAVWGPGMIDFETGVGSVEVKYCSTGDSTWAEERFTEFYDFVYNNDGQAFTEGIEQYLDLDTAIDYMLFSYYIYGCDNSAKNILWITYDGEKWIPIPYDLDGTFGLHWSGERRITAEASIPEIQPDGTVLSNYENVLWDRLWNNYPEKIAERYFELREEVLTADNVYRLFCEFTETIPEEAFLLDQKLYPEMPGIGVETTEDIRAFIEERSGYLDIFMKQLEENAVKTGEHTATVPVSEPEMTVQEDVQTGLLPEETSEASGYDKRLIAEMAIFGLFAVCGVGFIFIDRRRNGRG